MTDETTDVLEDNAEGTEDFDAYWSSIDRGGKTTTIMGEKVTLPPSLPLQFQLEAQRLQKSKREQDIQKLVGILFGASALEAWTKKGMDLHQLMVLLAWAPQIISGVKVTLAEVDAELRALEAEAASGKAGPKNPT